MKNEDEVKPREDGTFRKIHYGADMQPWDHIVALGWGPIFAAGNVLKYLRRSKDPVHSLASARWYYARLKEMKALNKVVALRKILTKEELDKLDKP